MSHSENLKSCGLQMHDPFLSCCETWYGINRFCYDFVLRETWHPEFSFQKFKTKSSSMIMKYLPRPYDLLSSLYTFSHMRLAALWVESYSRYPRVRLWSCTHDMRFTHPPNKANSHTEKLHTTCNLPSTKKYANSYPESCALASTK
jgi:hypothetical protein